MLGADGHRRRRPSRRSSTAGRVGTMARGTWRQRGGSTAASSSSSSCRHRRRARWRRGQPAPVPTTRHPGQRLSADAERSEARDIAHQLESRQRNQCRAPELGAQRSLGHRVPDARRASAFCRTASSSARAVYDAAAGRAAPGRRARSRRSQPRHARRARTSRCSACATRRQGSTPRASSTCASWSSTTCGAAGTRSRSSSRSAPRSRFDHAHAPPETARRADAAPRRRPPVHLGPLGAGLRDAAPRRLPPGHPRDGQLRLRARSARREVDRRRAATTRSRRTRRPSSTPARPRWSG